MRESPVWFRQRRPISPRGAEARGAALRSHTPCTDDTSSFRGVLNVYLLAKTLLVGENIVPVRLKRENANC
jgi:hypothetical protein